MKKEHNVEELEKEIRNSKDSRYIKRVQAIKLRKQQFKVKEILKILSIVPNTYYYWQKSYKEKGLEGLKNIKSGHTNGNKKFPDEPFEALFKEIDKMEVHWTLDKMSIWIEEKFNIYIQPKTIQKRLYRANYSWKTNRPSPYKGDKKKQNAFKKTLVQS